MHSGKALIFSAPSGTGKSTIVNHLLEVRKDLRFSVSATTRSPRKGEEDGVHYFFFSPEDFRSRIANDELVEWEEVYPDRYYGTLKSELERIWAEGNHVVFDVDVVGGVNLKKQLGKKALSLFIKAGIETIENRLRNRGTDSEEEIKKRLAKTRDELAFQDKFDRIIVNEDLQTAFRDTEDVVNTFLAG